MPLAGRPMVEWSIAAFRASENVVAIAVARPPGRTQQREGGDLDGGDLVFVEGGATRSESVSNALTTVDTELVAIHDAARPLVTPELVEGVVAALVADPEAAGAIAATPVTDTIKKAGVGSTELLTGSDAYRVIKPSEVVEATVDRSRLWAAQTPQVFRTEALREALAAYPDDAPPITDEAMLVEAAGGRVLIHPASAENLKVTTPFDLKLAELLIERG